MSKWFAIRAQTEQKNMKYVSNKVRGFPEEYAGKYFFQLMQSVGADAADVGRNYMQERVNWTATGIDRKADGGNGPGRVDTGKMQKAFKHSVIKVGKKQYEASLGWNGGEPGYAIFQEYGIQNGVQGMHALRYAQEFYVREMKLRGAAGKSIKANKVPDSFDKGDSSVA